MSGGDGPYADSGVPKEHRQQPSAAGNRQQNRPASAAPGRKLLSLTKKLMTPAIIVFFFAAGLVAWEDLAFVLFSLLYTFFLSKAAFPSAGPPPAPVFDRNSKLLRRYVLAGAAVGLYLPMAYIIHGISQGHKEGVKAAAAHVFLLASQVVAEILTAWQQLSIPVRAFVPICFNSRRIFAIIEWIRAEVGKESGGMGVLAGRALAAANMAFWCFNLFGFLLPVYLPRAFKKYYSPADNSKEK